MKDLPKVIARIQKVADLPPEVRSLHVDELLRLHDNLEAAEFEAKKAAAALKEHIRALKVPISQAELLPTAYHEAGHAVAELVHQRRFESVSLSMFRFESHVLGEVSSGPIRGPLERRLLDWQIDYTEKLPSPSEKARLRQEAITLLAGLEAERRLDDFWTRDEAIETVNYDRLLWMMLDHPNSSDTPKVLKLAWALTLTKSKGRLRENFPRYYPEDWKHDSLEPLECFLIGLPDSGVDFLNRLAVEARQLVDTHWTQVERIAQALVESKRLTYGQCLKLFNHRARRRSPDWKSLRPSVQPEPALQAQASG